MIEEDYVSIEVAKLLKEKGFDERCRQYYYKDNLILSRNGICNEELNNYKEVGEGWSAPTPQMVMNWLEEVHHILVVVDYVYECTDTSWVYKIYRLGENGRPERCVVKGTSYDGNNNPTEHITGYRDYELSYKDYGSRREAEDEGIRYVLEKYV